ncbi:MAG: hypothetical protein EOP86_00895 [Verrucomicrobiaceae bacterium]|nr:MAG: hypothetical protein EOP86_00895 [Verrucomicrobiaceae bacterium]
MMKATDSKNDSVDEASTGKNDTNRAEQNAGPTLNKYRPVEDPPGTESPPMPPALAQQQGSYVSTKEPPEK